MRFFRVIGNLAYEDTWYCGCHHCDGHGSDKAVIKHIDMVVMAKDEQQAVFIAQDIKLPHQIEQCEWASGPSVLEAPTDHVMRLIEAPMLPGIKKANVSQ